MDEGLPVRVIGDLSTNLSIPLKLGAHTQGCIVSLTHGNKSEQVVLTFVDFGYFIVATMKKENSLER